MCIYRQFCLVSETTGDSPFYLIYGREPRLPIDISLIPPEDPSSSIAEHRTRIVKQIELSHDIARQNIQRAQQKMKEYYDRNAAHPTFEIGERVWVFTPKTKKGLSKKLMHIWYGPYRIVNQLSPVHYTLRTCDNKRVSTSVHANHMKRYLDPDSRPIEPLEDDIDEPYLDDSDIDDDTFRLIDNSLPHNNDINSDKSKPKSRKTTKPKAVKQIPSTDQHQTTEPNNISPQIDNQTIFNAERLLKSKTRKGKTQYLVKWVGVPEDQNTWENEENIFDQRLLDNFNKQNY